METLTPKETNRGRDETLRAIATVHGNAKPNLCTVTVLCRICGYNRVIKGNKNYCPWCGCKNRNS